MKPVLSDLTSLFGDHKFRIRTTTYLLVAIGNINSVHYLLDGVPLIMTTIWYGRPPV